MSKHFHTFDQILNLYFKDILHTDNISIVLLQGVEYGKKNYVLKMVDIDNFMTSTSHDGQLQA